MEILTVSPFCHPHCDINSNAARRDVISVGDLLARRPFFVLDHDLRRDLLISPIEEVRTRAETLLAPILPDNLSRFEI